MVLTVPPAAERPHISMRDSYFARIATDLWDGSWEAIIATRSADDQERLFIEATILCKYGKSLSLRGSPEKVCEALALARSGGRQPSLHGRMPLARRPALRSLHPLR